MKDLREILNEVSKEKGFVSWKDCLRSTDFGQLDNVVMIAMSRYADEKTKEFQEENETLRDQQKQSDDLFTQADIDSLKIRLKGAEATVKRLSQICEDNESDWGLIVNRLKAKNKKRKKRIKSLKTELEEANFHKDVYRKMLYHLKGLGL